MSEKDMIYICVRIHCIEICKGVIGASRKVLALDSYNRIHFLLKLNSAGK